MSDTTFADVLEKTVIEREDAMAIEHQGRGMSYVSLKQRAELLAKSLDRRSISGPGSCIGLTMRQSPEMIIMNLAASMLGTTVAFASDELGEEPYANAMNHAKADVISVSRESTLFLKAVASRLDTVKDFIVEDTRVENQATIPGMATPLSALMQPTLIGGEESRLTWNRPAPDNVEFMEFGRPAASFKAYATPSGALDWEALQEAASEIFRQDDVVLCLGASPGLHAFLLGSALPLLAGARIAQDHEADPEELPRIINKHAATAVYATMEYADKVLRAKTRGGNDVSGVRFIVPAHAPYLADKFARQLRCDVVDPLTPIEAAGISVKLRGTENYTNIFFQRESYGTREESV